ncbi:MAG TPA: MgtC/SapB family protein [Candidatus Binatia bacterium]|jgi:putative Mg2+ transporter-C (MgtC) family protein
MMDILLEEIISGLPDIRQTANLVIRLMTAMILGGVIGAQRESIGKPAGLRTHMLVAMGGALFVLAPLEVGMELDGISRVIQGIVTGIGFLGAGAILKLHEKREIEGLTTAAGIWMTAAVGIAAGLGRWGLALFSTALTWLTLSIVRELEAWMNEKL